MRSSKSRSRSRSNRNKPSGNIINRVFDSSGPEGKVRGTPQQIIDKYNQLARDAQLSGDRVATENFQQHAEHYTRLLSEAQREIDSRREEQERQNRERQAERDRQADRDRERNAQRQDNNGGDLSSDPAEAPQPDVVDTAGDSNLVDTPESQPKPKPPRTRKPRNKPAQNADGANAESDNGSAPEAAE